MDWDTISHHLSQPLDPRAIKPPPEGKHGDYVDGYHVIREANRIFGYNGWSYAITSMDRCSRTETTDKYGNPQVRVAYRCTVRVTVDGVTREGAAVGTGIAKMDSEGDAHESAVKEAETDAMKRGLRSFGNTFGLALYEKDKSKREVGKPQQLFDSRKGADWMLEKIGLATTKQQLRNWRAGQNVSDLFNRLDQPHQNEVTKQYDETVEKLPNDPAMQAPPQENAEGGHEYA